MAEPSSHFRLRQFSSSELPAEDRLELWRSTITKHMIHLAIDPLAEGPFMAEASLRKHDGLVIGTGTISPSISLRSREIVNADNDDLFLMLNLSGSLVLQSGSRELTLRPGEATLLCCAESGLYVRPEVGSVSCVRLPRAALTPFVAGLEDRIFRLIPGNIGALKFLRTYLDALTDPAEVDVPQAVSRTVSNHVTDLIALTLGATGEAAAAALGGGLRAARLTAAKAFIEQRIGPAALSIEDVAEHMGVSARYVRKLFETEGGSFSKYVLQQRLARVHAMLTNARFDHVPISSLAYDVGFGDLSYFNKVFRTVFGGTPSDVRHSAAQRGEHRLQAALGMV
jgi:AraC-like DNA-binding protein